jgi:hypothetical protein
MLSIQDGEALSRALNSSISIDLNRLLRLRRGQLNGDIADQARFVIVQPLDTILDVEHALGFSLDGEYGHGPEWAQNHGSLIELCWIFTDDGFAHVLIVPDADGIDSELLNLSRKYASETA